TVLRARIRARGARQGAMPNRSSADSTDEGDSSAAEPVDRELAPQVREHADRTVACQHDALLDDAIALVQERVEIGDRTKMNVRRVVPLVRESRRDQHPP